MHAHTPGALDEWFDHDPAHPIGVEFEHVLEPICGAFGLPERIIPGVIDRR